MMRVENQTFDKEREFYGSSDVTAVNCTFEGPADGESAFKESRNVTVEGCVWKLRYPFWHDTGVTMKNTELTELCRAAFWYSEKIEIIESKLHGVKAMRECSDIVIRKSDIVSPEFGWSVKDIRIEDSTAAGEYFMMRSSDMIFKNVEFTGKYSFQYVENAVIEDCVLHTKDAFWHAKNVVIKNCVVEGEYLAWYAEDIIFENCKISGTQPFCYCKNLKLINCEMTDADLSFEKSEVEAEITTPVISIKNPKSGCIKVPAVEELIMDDPEAKCEVIIG